jgi:hypothetical protein
MQVLKNYKNLTISILCLLLLANHGSHGYTSEPAFSSSYKLDTLEKISMMFEVKYGETNLLDIKRHPVFKRHEDEFRYSSSDKLPDGLTFSSDGILQWSPTRDQFVQLKANPIAFTFQALSANGHFASGQIRMLGTGDVPPVEVATLSTEEKRSEAAKVEVIVAKVEEIKALDPITISFEKHKGWDTKAEGETFEISFTASGGSGEFKFELLEPGFLMENLDQYGTFVWTPDFDFVTSEQSIRSVILKIKVFDTEGNEMIESVPVYVEHVNRPPVVNELPTFYIQYNIDNIYQLNKKGIVYDPDGDSIIFSPVLKELPQGMVLSAAGKITWNPSRRQLNYLYANPIYLSFTVEDYPSGAKSIGQIKLEVSQADLPPEIAIIPNKQSFEIKEDDELHLSFFVTDPNGQEDLMTFNFVTENSSITANALKKKGDWQYEFSWTPGYDFILEEGQKHQFDISFFAIDLEGNRTEKNILVTVVDTENILEKDKLLYDQYRSVLAQAFDLVSQLNEKEKELEKKYRIAKKGKKNRAITTASLGALTGLSPVIFIENPDGQKIAAGLGGTATATIGTLEASSVIGESPTDLMRDLNYVSQKRSDLLIYGNIFASKYALPMSKRDKGFQSDLRTLSIQLNLQDIAKLELDAAWENSKDASARNIKRVFKDFNQDPRFEDSYD